MQATTPRHEEILRFWFGPPDGDPFVNQSMWWKKDANLDRTIQDRFGEDLEAATRGEYDDWAGEPRKALALIVLLDQFSRNIHRGTPRSFAQDEKALRLTLEGIERGQDEALSPVERHFFYMPLMHSEDLDIQKRAVAMFARLADSAPREQRENFENALDFAERHRAIVERFGRFPHRNEILDRPSTPEEIEFLKQPGSSF